MGNKSIWGVLVLALLAGLFLIRALATPQTLVPADIVGQMPPWSQLAEIKSVKNPIISDITDQVFPYQVFLRDELSQGRLPLWNPYVQTGVPFLANSVSAALNPFQMVFLLLPQAAAMEWSAWFKLLLAGVGIYLLAIRLGLRPQSALVAAAAYQLAAYQIFYLGFSNTWVSGLLGWQLWTLEGYLKKGRHRDLAATGAVLALGYLGGQMENALLLHLSTGLYALVRAPRRVPAVFGGLLLGFIAAAAAVLPFADLVTKSANFATRLSVQGGHLTWDQTPVFILPHFVASSSLFRAPPFGTYYFAHLGVPMMLLALASLPWATGKTRSKNWFLGLKRWEWALWALVAWSGVILLAVWPFWELFNSLPLVGAGNHHHIAFVLQGALALLAGLGVERIVESRGVRLLPWAAALLGLAAGILFILQASALWSEPQSRFFFVSRLLPLPLYPLLAVALVGGLWWFQGKPGFAYYALGAVILQSFSAGFFFNTVCDPSPFLTARPEIIRQLQTYPHQRYAALGTPVMVPNVNMIYPLRDVRGYESLSLQRYARYMQPLVQGDLHYWIPDLEAQQIRVLKRAGCRFLVSAKPLDLTDLEPLETDSELLLYRIPGGQRARVASEVVLTDDPEEALKRTQGPAFFGAAVIENADSSMRESASGQVRWITDNPDEIVLDVSMQGPGWLILHDAWEEGWRVEVDGRPDRIYRADYLFRGVHLPEGRSRVRFVYRPWAFTWGVVLSLVGLLGLGLLVFPPRPLIRALRRRP
ncbi:MAG TPA: YfhO family protein [Acidobacteriota bacterium]|nr:YfhO family protein [Acidobacteriota bacterium]